MFALEIIFTDGVSQPEMVFIRRPQALVGASDFAHVAVEDLKQLNYQLRVIRDIGRNFRCHVSRGSAGDAVTEEFRYDRDALLDVGPVRFNLTALDVDLALRDGEPPDRAGVRILRQACSTSSPTFPAVVVGGAHPMVISFVADQPIYVGRSRQCAIRLDSADVSGRHARIGFEGGEFWVEDLGSTNGTFVDQSQISGRVSVPAGTPIIVGREISLVGVVSEDQIHSAPKEAPQGLEVKSDAEAHYPALVALSEVARPARLVLAAGQSYSLGRDPSSDMWLGAPHISRRHCVVSVDGSGGRVTVTDFSTNGTAHNAGILHRGEQLNLEVQGTSLDFGSGVMVAICFSPGEEQEVLASHPVQRPEPVGQVVPMNKTEPVFSPLAQEDVEESIVETGSPGGGGRIRRFLTGFRGLDGWGKFVVIATILMCSFVLVVICRLAWGSLKG